MFQTAIWVLVLTTGSVQMPSKEACFSELVKQESSLAKCVNQTNGDVFKKGLIGIVKERHLIKPNPKLKPKPNNRLFSW